MNYLTVPEEVRREVETPTAPEPVIAEEPALVTSVVSHVKSASKHLSRTSHTSWGHGSLKSKPSRSSTRIQPSYTSMGQTWDHDRKKSKKTKVRGSRKKQMAMDELIHICCIKIMIIFHSIQYMLSLMVKSLVFEIFIFSVVCFNTVILVVQTFAEVEVWGEWYFTAFDSFFLCVYFLEAVFKILVLGLSYFHSWHSLDFFIMVVALVDFILKQIYFSSSKRMAHSKTLFRILKIFKSLRALRAVMVLQRLSFLNSLTEMTGTLTRSLPSIGAILTLMFTCLFFFSVILRALFSEADPKHFNNIFRTIFTLFTMLTLDDWSLIYLASRDKGAWYIIPILMIYIIIQYFIFLNLVIAVLVDNFQMALLKGLEKEKQKKVARMQEKLLDESLTNLATETEKMSDTSLQMQIIEKKYGDLTSQQQDKMFHYLQLMAAVEHHQQVFRSQAAVIDELIDTVFEAGEDDFTVKKEVPK